MAYWYAEQGMLKCVHQRHRDKNRCSVRLILVYKTFYTTNGVLQKIEVVLIAKLFRIVHPCLVDVNRKAVSMLISIRRSFSTKFRKFANF